MELDRSGGALQACERYRVLKLWRCATGVQMWRYGVRELASRGAGVQTWRYGMLEARCRCSDVEVCYVLFCMPEIVEGELCLMEAREAMRCVLLCNWRLWRVRSVRWRCRR